MATGNGNAVESGSGIFLVAQPMPLRVRVGRMPTRGGEVVTGITRKWPPGATRTCRLCDACSADHEDSSCTILTKHQVPKGGAALFSTRGGRVLGADGRIIPGLRVVGTQGEPQVEVGQPGDQRLE